MKHFHIYDTTGEVMCVDAHMWQRNEDMVIFYAWAEAREVDDVQYNEVAATFNWSNVVCVREEEDDDEGETAGIPPVFSGALN
jgi:hypothetical protein